MSVKPTLVNIACWVYSISVKPTLVNIACWVYSISVKPTLVNIACWVYSIRRYSSGTTRNHARTSTNKIGLSHKHLACFVGYGSLRWSVLEVFAVCDVSAALGTILPPLLPPTPLPVIPSSHLGCFGSLRYHLAPSTAPSRLHPSRYLRHLICDVSAALGTILPPLLPPTPLSVPPSFPL